MDFEQLDVITSGSNPRPAKPQIVDASQFNASEDIKDGGSDALLAEVSYSFNTPTENAGGRRMSASREMDKGGTVIENILAVPPKTMAVCIILLKKRLIQMLETNCTDQFGAISRHNGIFFGVDGMVWTRQVDKGGTDRRDGSEV